GFEQAVQRGGESRNPTRNIPLAIIGAMVGAIALYVALQVAFIAALDPSSLSDGWGATSFPRNGQLFVPFAALATGLWRGGVPRGRASSGCRRRRCWRRQRSRWRGRSCSSQAGR